MFEEYIDKAKTLVEALPYINEFRGITVVIKYGGSAMGNDEINTAIIQDIALMKFVGFKPVVVHGGGPEISAMLKRLDIHSEFVKGLRITTDDAIEVVEMVLAGKLNKQITTQLSMQGIKAVGVSGKDAHMLKVNKLMPEGADIGFVGEICAVDTKLIQTLIDNDFVPVIAPIGFDENGDTYNINADYASVAVAGALNAEKLVFLTDVAGVMRDINDSRSVYSRLTVSQAQDMIESGEISGGMIPKVECCVKGVEAGASHVHILDGRVMHSLLLEIFTKDGIGTLIEKG